MNDNTNSVGGQRQLALHHLARLCAGASDLDIHLIRDMWPDIPCHDGNLAATWDDLQGWLDAHSDVAQAVLAMDPEATPSNAQIAGWAWRTLADAYRPHGPRRYVVAGLLPLPSLCSLYGTPGSLKTMLLIDLALSVAGGKPWLPGIPDLPLVEPYRCQQVPVLWIDVDNGWDRLERRLAALGQTHGVPKAAPISYISFPNPPFVAGESESVQRVVDKAHTIGAGLIIVDNLGTISGGADENSSQMVGVMSGLRQIAETTGSAVVVIHHKNKGDRARLGDSLRGHSSIEGALDLALMVEREDGEDAITLRSTKSRDAPVDPFVALWTYTVEGTELVKGQFFGLGKPEKAASSKGQQAREVMMKNIEPGMNQSKIVEMVKAKADIGRSTTLSALNGLVREGKLITRPGAKNNETLYYAPGDLPSGN